MALVDAADLYTHVETGRLASASMILAEATSVDAFLEAVAPAVRQSDARALIDLMSRLTGEPPLMWGPSIIGFGAARLRYDSGRQVDVPVLCFSPRKAAQSIYLTDGAAAHTDLLARLGRHRAATGCLYVTRLADVDLSVLEEILARSRDATRERDVATRD